MPIGEGDRWSRVSKHVWNAFRTIWGRFALFKKGSFDPFRVGLDHIALAIEDSSILEGLKQELDAAGVRNNGVEVDPETHDKYISFYDPDGIAWELYSVTDPPYV